MSGSKHRGRALMVLGTSSSVGKSFLVAGMARYFADRGVKVAPFKSQNISNNSRVVDGGEMGAAQYLQALAARIAPEVRMNPVLIKPESGARSQVVVMGRPDFEVSRTPWLERGPLLWAVIQRELHRMLEDYDLVLLEGAGSPAEINLMAGDLANIRTAREAGAPVLLVADIDRGGAFAHLYGTWALLPPEDRRLIRGFVLNMFRGDASLLAPAPEMLRKKTGVPVVGVLPHLSVSFPEEDAARLDRAQVALGGESAHPSGDLDETTVVAVVRYPLISNTDELKVLERVPGVRLLWVDDPRVLEGLNLADLVVLPGSKHVSADLQWLRATGLADGIEGHAERGGAVLGICGGLQMLGGEISDPDGVEGQGEGLGLLALKTVFSREKVQRRGEWRFGELEGFWRCLSGQRVDGYEIRHGRTEAIGEVGEAIGEGVGFVAGSVLGLYLHGLFENPGVVGALFWREVDAGAILEESLDRMAAAVGEHLDMEQIEALIGDRAG